ncbi:anti-sigma factor [Streptomyces sp. XD-27]|uniref:anti-sigma factor family protein n=1 Tax=Streptomyces sp. XD-27 TaxID=3062779 RepID=UPI0026F4431F|nr:zf-HC2 domain-containing protein [Streptomyces sp. XD-27]WKX70631.1 zf-HC2 domain-containing protein [Streptomyces sp. XD-27]
MTPPAEYSGNSANPPNQGQPPHSPNSASPPDSPHTDVGAYALGILDDADAIRFEAHLAGCDRCAAELDGLMGLPPLLADFAASAPDPQAITARPGPEMLDRLLAEAAAGRRTSRRRRLYLVGAAAALIIAGPLATAALTSASDSSGADRHPSVQSLAEEMYRHGEKTGATDPRTKVSATVALEQKPWGTHVVLRLANVRGPERCDLVAVGKNGERQTVTTWSVPPPGYGLPDGGSEWSRKPLYAHGGAALNRDEIDRFEVRTLGGVRLATVKL